MSRRIPLALFAAALLSMALVTAAPAVAGDIYGITVLTATERLNDDVGNNFFEATIQASGVDNAMMVDLVTGHSYWLMPDISTGLLTYRDSGYATIGALSAVHPTPTIFEFYLNATPGGGFQDAVIVNYNQPMPSDYCRLTSLTYVGDTPTLTWDFAGEADYMGQAIIKDSTGETVFVQYADGAAPGTWTPGALEPATDYSVVLGAWNVVTGDTKYVKTLNGDYFTFIGIMNDSNRITFVTADTVFGDPIPEPATLALLATGLAGGLWMRGRKK